MCALLVVPFCSHCRTVLVWMLAAKGWRSTNDSCTRLLEYGSGKIVAMAWPLPVPTKARKHTYAVYACASVLVGWR